MNNVDKIIFVLGMMLVGLISLAVYVYMIGGYSTTMHLNIDLPMVILNMIIVIVILVIYKRKKKKI